METIHLQENFDLCKDLDTPYLTGTHRGFGSLVCQMTGPRKKFIETLENNEGDVAILGCGLVNPEMIIPALSKKKILLNDLEITHPLFSIYLAYKSQEPHLSNPTKEFLNNFQIVHGDMRRCDMVSDSYGAIYMGFVIKYIAESNPETLFPFLKDIAKSLCLKKGIFFIEEFSKEELTLGRRFDGEKIYRAIEESLEKLSPDQYNVIKSPYSLNISRTK